MRLYWASRCIVSLGGRVFLVLPPRDGVAVLAFVSTDVYRAPFDRNYAIFG